MDAKDKLAIIRRANEKLRGALEKCTLCPRMCGTDRSSGKLGYCRAPADPVVYSYISHHGEEPPLSGNKGSGTIFFTHCNMKCIYCQNYYFSQLDNGEIVSVQKLASIMLGLQSSGCHNINLVSPTHFVPQILMALEIALEKGLIIPIIYNTGGYDREETIRTLEGIIDIYMPDMRYSDNVMAIKYSDAPDYVENNRASVKEMRRQAGDLILDGSNIAIKGLIVRLLVLPENISGIRETLRFINKYISPNTYLSIMSQYYPTYKAYNFKEISHCISEGEYKNVLDEAHSLGLNNGWIQKFPENVEKRFLGTNIEPKK